MTRARAAEVAETLQVDEDAVLDIPDNKISHLKPATPPSERSRSPLGELAPNSAESKESEQVMEAAQQPSRGRKGGKKGGKGKKKNLCASTTSQPEEAEEAPPEHGAQIEGGVELDASQDGVKLEDADALEGACDSVMVQDVWRANWCRRGHVSDFTARPG